MSFHIFATTLSPCFKKAQTESDSQIRKHVRINGKRRVTRWVTRRFDTVSILFDIEINAFLTLWFQSTPSLKYEVFRNSLNIRRLLDNLYEYIILNQLCNYLIISYLVHFTSSNIKYIDNQLVTVSKVQMICKCMHKTTYTKYKGTLFIMTSFYFYAPRVNILL